MSEIFKNRSSSIVDRFQTWLSVWLHLLMMLRLAGRIELQRVYKSFVVKLLKRRVFRKAKRCIFVQTTWESAFLDIEIGLNLGQTTLFRVRLGDFTFVHSTFASFSRVRIEMPCCTFRRWKLPFNELFTIRTSTQKTNPVYKQKLVELIRPKPSLFKIDQNLQELY